MGEATQYYLEKMLPELDDFERRGIFTTVEIKAIAQQRTILETAIHARAPKKHDYIKYIHYEVNLETLRRKRKVKYALNQKPDKGESGVTLSDYSLLKRIHSLYQKVLKKYHGDSELWMQYFKWASDVGSSKTLGVMFAKAILLHPNNVTFFILSAGWEFEQIGNIDSARAIFQAGLRINPKSRLLWQEYYKFELLALEKIRQRQQLLQTTKQDASEVDVNVVKLDACFKSIPGIVYKNGCDALGDDFEFRLSLLLLSRKFGGLFANDYGFIVQEMTFKFKNDVEKRDLIAKSFFDGLTEVSDQDELVQAFEGCLREYESALSDNATIEMMDCSILTLRELESCHADSCLKESISSALADALEMAENMVVALNDE